MAETEVESILREIRERVLAQERAGQDVMRTSAMTNGGNGAGDSGVSGMQDRGVTESLALLNSYLTTTARAWDRLPPVVSNRSGFSARVELWLKRNFKRATRWYAWEQVNFNAAVHHALRDLLPLLAAYEQELGKLRAQIQAEGEARGRDSHAEAEARRRDLAQHHVELAALRVELRGEIEAQNAELKAEINARVAEVVSELRERDEHLRDEQRVGFKQLALESSEGAVLEDRARRKTEALLGELQHRLEQLEKK